MAAPQPLRGGQPHRNPSLPQLSPPPAATAVCYCHRHRLNHPAPPSAAPGAASPTTDRRLLTFRPQLSATTWPPPSADPTPPRPSHTARGHRRLPLHHLNRYAPPSASPHRPPTTDCRLPAFPPPPSVTAHLPPSTAAATGLRDTGVRARASMLPSALQDSRPPAGDGVDEG